MQRYTLSALWWFAGLPTLLGAQGFGLNEHNICAMGRAGVAAASPCPDGSAIFFNPAGLAGLSGWHASAGVTLIEATGGFTDDILARKTGLENPLIPLPNGFVSHAVTPKVGVGIGVTAPYGLETKWPTEGFQGRFLGYNTRVQAIYVQPTIAYQVHERLAVGLGVAYVRSEVELHQRADLSTQSAAPGVTFGSLGILTGTDFADATLEADGTGVAVNFGATVTVTDRLTIGGHWLTRKTIGFEGEAAFRRILTGLTLPANNPLGLPGGTPVDALLAAQFGAGAPLDTTGVPATTDITLPAQGTIGIAYKLRDNWTVMFDYQLVLWSAFDRVTIDFGGTSPDLTLAPNNDDTHGFRFGAEYQHSPKVTFRGGYLYHTSASPDEFVTPLLPESDRNEITLGVSVNASQKIRADVAYQLIRQNDRRGRVFDASIGNTGLYEFTAHLFGFGLVYTF